MNIKHAAIFLLALLHPFFLRAADAPGDVRELHPIWEERFRDRPIVRLADDRTLTDTWLLSGIDGNSSMLAVVLTDHILSRYDEYAIRSTVLLASMLERARELKGGELSMPETTNIEKLHKRQEGAFARTHPLSFKIHILHTFLAQDMDDTIGNTRDIPKALERIARQHGCACDYRCLDSVTEEALLQFLNEGTPLVLENRTKASGWNPFASDKGRWRLVFGSCRDEDGKLQLLVNIPEETPVLKQPMGCTVNDLESTHRDIIIMINRDRSKEYIPLDIRSLPENLIAHHGFVALPFPAVADCRVHVLRNWRRSAEAWDRELRTALNLPEPASKPEPLPPPGAAASAAELWRYYFVQQRGDAGIGFEGGLMPEWRLLRSGAGSLTDTMLSLIGTQRPDFVAYPLSKGKMWHHSRLFLGNSFLVPEQEELDAIIALAEAEWGKFVAAHGEIAVPAGMDKLEKTDRMVYVAYQEKKNKPHAPLDEQLLFCLPKLWKNARTPQEALEIMKSSCGWTAIVEGGADATWDTCKRALQRKIPIVLQHRDGREFRLAVAYLTHNDRRLLLAADFSRLEQETPMTVHVLPADLPAGMDFVEFNPAEWTPWFVHHFEPTVEHLAPQILEIFKAHPEAQAIMKKDADKTATPGQ